MSDETTLLPCPFCGGEAELKRYQSGDWQVICYHADGCIMLESDLDNCYWENVQTLARQWNARAERTCEPKWTLQGETQTQEFWRCECGNCGHEFGVEDRSSFPFKMTIDKVEIPNFCPNCGARVVC